MHAGPHDVRIALLLGDCYLQTGQFPQAIGLLTPLSAPPGQQDALDYVLGLALIRGGRAAEGQVHVNRILSRGDSAEGHFLLGSALFSDISRCRPGVRQGRSLEPAGCRRSNRIMAGRSFYR